VWVEPLETGVLCLLVVKTAMGFGGWVGGVLSMKFLNYFGSISYGLYIYHFMVINACDRWMPEDLKWLVEVPWARLFTCFSLSILAAVISWHWLEQPVYRLLFKNERGEAGENLKIKGLLKAGE
jgi:peptidoglycan/LPS O-acetylase OafA/YrhL